MKILLLVSFIYLVQLLSAQPAPEIGWQKSFGGTSTDIPYSIIQNNNENYIVTGLTYSSDGDIDSHYGGHDVWILELDTLGNMIWKKNYGGTGQDEMKSIVNTADGGYIMAGSSTSSDFDLTENNGNQDYWIVKLDSAGTIEWQKSYGGSNPDLCQSVIETDDGNYLVAGISSSYDGDVTDHHGSFGSCSDAWLLKLDSIGNVIWKKSYGGSGCDGADDIAETNDHGFIVVCSAKSVDGDKTSHHGSTAYFDVWMFKIDSTGNLLWEKSLGGTSDDYSKSVEVDSENGFYILGNSNSNDDDVAGHHGSTTTSDYWIVKTDSIGNIEWNNSYGGTKDDYAGNIILNDSSCILSGFVLSDNGDVSEHYGTTESDDIWILKISLTGEIIWEKSYGGTSYEERANLYPAADGGYIVSAISYSNDIDVTETNGSGDYWIFKLNPDTCNYLTYYMDADADGFGNAAIQILSCDSFLTGYVLDSTDCDDANNMVHPVASEVCNTMDENCNGEADEGLTFVTYYLDADGDDFGNSFFDSVSCLDAVAGYVLDSSDCNDADSLINPLAHEICNAADENCNGNIDEDLTQYTLFMDADNDNFGNALIDTTTCFDEVAGYTPDNTDCDDTNPSIYPGATEILDGVDNNCNDTIDEGLVNITDINFNYALNVYPNPAQNNFTIQLQLNNSINSSARIAILNMIGEEVCFQNGEIINGELNEKTTLENNISNGIYLVKMIIQHTRYVTHLIIQR